MQDKRRPDGQIQTIPTQTSQISMVGFMEAEQVSESINHSKINMDLIHLGIFGKNAIDTRSLDASMLIQAVGTNLAFYLVKKKPTDDIYKMLELDHIRFPTSLNEVKGFYGFADNICDIMQVFSRECSGPGSCEAQSHKSSMKSPLL